MSLQKKLILIVGIITAVLVTGIRFFSQGWLFLFGMASILLFGILHFFLLRDIYRYYDQFFRSDKFYAWMGVVLYALVFLFQFDFGDSAGTFYVYEAFIGRNDSNFEHVAYWISIVAGIVYLITYVRWRIMMKAYSR